MAEENPNAEAASLLSVKSVHPSPDTLTKLVRRLKALTVTLLPVEVDIDSLKGPSSRVVTPQVIDAFIAAAGDYTEALPYCLLRARWEFLHMADRNPADYDENYARAMACEVIARRVIHRAPADNMVSMMSARFHRVNRDGDSDLASALEMAIDTDCIIFLSSAEAQDVVNRLWSGALVHSHKNNQHNDVEYIVTARYTAHSFWDNFDPSRISVPQYQNMFRVIVWLFFLFVYSQAVREPLDKIDPDHLELDVWEAILYFIALSFALEDATKWYKLIRFATWKAFGFWDVVSFLTEVLLVTAFILRITGIVSSSDQAPSLRIRSFQVLSFVAPLIWMKVLTVFDGFKYFGTMQICVSRMLQESGIFFALLSVLALGFWQGLYALDAADGSTEQPVSVVNVMIQALLQAPNYDKFSLSPAGLTLYYFWNVVTSLILLNVLISLFSSAYSDVVDAAEAEYLAFFASKTVRMIRAPDEFVYPAPFNLIELVFVVPFELLPIGISARMYAKYNRVIMTVIFFPILVVIALYELTLRRKFEDWFWTEYEEDTGSPDVRDPVITGEDIHSGMKISRIPFDDIVKSFPNTTQSSESNILNEIANLKEMVANLSKALGERAE